MATTTKNIDGKKVQVTGRFFTWSNMMSFSRILVAFPIVYIHYHNDFEVNNAIYALILYGVLSDYLDGFIARQTNTISEVGKMIDPVADKLCALVLFIYTVWIGWIPLWFLLFAMARDISIMVGSYYIKKKYDKVAMAIMSGKISVNVLALYWIAVFFFPEAQNVHLFLMASSVTLMVISWVDYFNRYRLIMSGAEFN
ncbi:CDP-alcohol phosphatidyltransferase family protein [Gracilimonas mengyeensis]|uniref:CDP-diacylglycerol--glycerol-3-phosphate 3-phosphatidyltransferase n=1 Tax=Gracilimonas mengyeensis TaxID=1302730 RepID=A0A521DE79_9BACT|nr:CDP-alcohol phosphatidyltransferase family protein [Gracilimonas mengyeensis]SMO69953.1 CDP-diacylglycerol--glycerol-3-phosphate 3-phosphatidyltransferase [Gracilimonas mengyeensis]